MPDSKPWARTVRCLRLLFFVLVALAVLFALLFVVHKGLLPLLAVALPSLESTFYDLAVYGVYRTRDFVSFDVAAPRVNIVRWHEACEGGHIFFGPYGDSVAVPGPSILDARGELVWYTDEFSEVTNFQMQTYHGENHITFWAGNKVGGVGHGALYMLDSSYQVVRKIHAVGEHLKGDLHEFYVTDRGTALMTIYNRTTMDLRPMGMFRGEQGWISDCIFQEIDIETGQLLFQWVASEHLKPERTYYAAPFSGYIASMPYDFFHLNSVERDSKGNYLISSRHFHTISYIDGVTGDILWELGGDSTDFTDLSGGAASDFKWQHHARWVDEEQGLLTLFDNGIAGPLHVDAPTSKSTLLQLDFVNMTASHVHSYLPANPVLSSSQGSAQVLPGRERILTGWGSSGMWTEHHIDGALLCEVHFGASIVYAWEWVKSYRIFKAWGWVGRPAYPPEARIDTKRLYVSWNGATEVRRWQLEGRRIDAQGPEDLEDLEDFEVIAGLDKQAFEESFLLPLKGRYQRYRVRALDADRNSLGVSNPVDPVVATGWAGRTVLVVVIAVSVAFGLALVSRRRSRRRSVGSIGIGIGEGSVGSGNDAAAGSLAAWLPAWHPTELLRWSEGQRYRYGKL